MIRVALPIAIVLSLAAHAAAHDLWTLLWMCHVSSLLIAIGIATDRRYPVAVGLIGHLALGWWGFAADAILTGVLAPTSVIVHVLPPAGAIVYLRKSGWPKHTAAWGCFAMMLLIPFSGWVAPPERNINLGHGPYEPLAALFPSDTSYWVVSVAVVVAFGLAIERFARSKTRHSTSESCRPEAAQDV